MKHTGKRARALGLIIALVLLIVGELHPTLRVQACSGGPSMNLDDMIDAAGVIVRAKIQQVDSLRQNAIVEVTSYFKGIPGPDSMLLVQTDPGKMAVFERMPNPGACDGGGKKLTNTDTAFLFLNRDSLDGAYRPIAGGGEPVILYEPGQKQGFTTNDGNDPWWGYDSEWSADELALYIATRIGHSPKRPRASSMLPRTAPLLIKTASGSHYIVPVDKVEPKRITEKEIRAEVGGWREIGLTRYAVSLPELSPNVSSCWTEGCFVISANRMMMGQLLPNSKIRWGISAFLDYDEFVQDGQAFALAPNDFRIAVWNQSTLQIYDLEREGLAEIKVSDGSASPLHAAWATDGRALAYSDARGLWLWEDDSRAKGETPRLLIPKKGDVVATPRVFSPRGHYLAITEGSENSILDLTTGIRWPDGVVSPDDQFLLTSRVTVRSMYRFEQNGDVPLAQVCALYAGRDACVDPGVRSDFRIQQIAWLGGQTFGYVVCPTSAGACQVYRADTEQVRNSQPGIAFDAEPLSGDLVVLKDKSTIRLDGIEYDLSKYLDGDIVSIQWLPSLLTSLEY